MRAKYLFLFMLGQVGMMGLTRFLFQWVLKFARLPVQDADGVIIGTLLAAGVAGWIFFAFRIFDGVTDPMAGALSDWWVRKGRRRQSLLWYSLPMAPLGLVLCFCADASMPIAMRWFLLTLGFFIFFVGYTLYAIPYWTLIEDYGKHTDGGQRSLSNMLGLGLIIATIIGFVVSPLLVDPEKGIGYRAAAIVFAIFSGLCMIAPIYAAPEEAQRPPPPVKERATLGEVFSSFLQAFRNRRFVALLALLAGSQMAFTILTSGAAFVAEQLLNGSEGDVSYLLGPLILTSLPMFYFAPKVSAKFGWEKSLMGASVLLGIVYCVCSTAGITIVYSPITTAMLMFGFAGPMIAILLSVEGEAITACARERDQSAVSMYFGVYNLVIKGLNGVSIALTGMLADLSDGPLGREAIRLMIIAAAILLFTGVIVSQLIKWTGKKQVES